MPRVRPRKLVECCGGDSELDGLEESDVLDEEKRALRGAGADWGDSCMPEYTEKIVSCKLKWMGQAPGMKGRDLQPRRRPSTAQSQPYRSLLPIESRAPYSRYLTMQYRHRP